MSARPLACPECRTGFEVADLADATWVVCPHCDRRLVVQEALACVATWYYARDTEQRAGPFSWPELRQLAARGEVLPSTWVSWQGAPRWHQAGAIPNLFPPTPVLSVPPAAGTSVEAESIFDDPDAFAAEQAGPLSLRGLRVQATRSVTLGDFQILRKLGAGATAGVYQAWQRSLKRPVALKVLAKHLALQPAVVERFTREARVMDSLVHPNIVRFYGTGKEEGFAFLAMELVEGFTTNALVARRGRFPVGDAVHCALVCARALHYAHLRDIVHRDIKPSNIMVNRLGHLKITDLGLARPVQEEMSLTATGVGVGTPEYMAPEQFHNAKHADRRSDVYGLGGVLYFLLTGKPPFQGDSMVRLFHLKEQGRFVSARQLNHEVPPRLDLIIDKMLARDRQYRYANCESLIADLERLALAHPHLSFNPLHTAPRTAVVDPGDRTEILLVQDDPTDILLAQEGLDEGRVPSNLNVVGSAAEALAFLRREGKYTSALRPNLIIFGRNLLNPTDVETIAAIKQQEDWRPIPLIILTTTTTTVEVLRERGLAVSLSIADVNDLRRLNQFIDQPISGSTVAVVRLPRIASETGREIDAVE
jgi:serine/threonine protein kinase